MEEIFSFSGKEKQKKISFFLEEGMEFTYVPD